MCYTYSQIKYEEARICSMDLDMILSMFYLVLCF